MTIIMDKRSNPYNAKDRSHVQRAHAHASVGWCEERRHTHILFGKTDGTDVIRKQTVIMVRDNDRKTGLMRLQAMSMTDKRNKF